MYAGAQLWGIWGFLLAPVAVLIFYIGKKSKIGIFLSKIYFNWQIYTAVLPEQFVYGGVAS